MGAKIRNSFKGSGDGNFFSPPQSGKGDPIDAAALMPEAQRLSCNLSKRPNNVCANRNPSYFTVGICCFNDCDYDLPFQREFRCTYTILNRNSVWGQQSADVLPLQHSSKEQSYHISSIQTRSEE
jgi:hypothetical protein